MAGDSEENLGGMGRIIFLLGEMKGQLTSQLSILTSHNDRMDRHDERMESLDGRLSTLRSDTFSAIKDVTDDIDAIAKRLTSVERRTMIIVVVGFTLMTVAEIALKAWPFVEIVTK